MHISPTLIPNLTSKLASSMDLDTPSNSTMNLAANMTTDILSDFIQNKSADFVSNITFRSLLNATFTTSSVVTPILTANISSTLSSLDAFMTYTSQMTLATTENVTNFTKGGATTKDCDQNKFALFDFIVDTVITGLITIDGILGNILGFIVLGKNPSTSTFLILRSLAVADSLFLVGSLIYHSLKTIYPYTGGPMWYYHYVIFPTIQPYVLPCWYVIQTASVWLVVLVTVHRFIAVCYPLHAQRLTVSSAKKQIAVTWVASAVYTLPRFFEYRSREVKSTCFNKTIVHRYGTPLFKDHTYQMVYGVAGYTVIIFIIPLTVLIILNAKLTIALARANRKRKTISTASMNRNALQTNTTKNYGKSEDKDNKLTLTIIIIIILFIILIFPDLVLQVIWRLSDDEQLRHDFAIFSNLFLVANSSLNFVVYCAIGQKFRQDLRDMFMAIKCKKVRLKSGCKKCCAKRHVETINNNLAHQFQASDSNLTLVSVIRFNEV